MRSQETIKYIKVYKNFKKKLLIIYNKVKNYLNLKYL